ncbi:hypothetical protein [Phytohabitans flavus]|uniref:hypothetical protein n=1 Tax=Phytohabitans flavus TaxID=1076124 RepID=UPI002F967189
MIGILHPVELAPEIDRAALIGFEMAAEDFRYDGHPSRIYVRADTASTAEVARMLPRATDPESPAKSTSAAPQTHSPPGSWSATRSPRSSSAWARWAC